MVKKKIINYKDNPDDYKYIIGRVGYNSFEPYSKQLLSHYNLDTDEDAKKSSQKIYKMFLGFLKRHDYIGADMARRYLQSTNKYFKPLYQKAIKNKEYQFWVQTKKFLQKQPKFDSFLQMHKDLKMPGSYRYGLVTNDDNEIVRLIINYHITSPDKFTSDLKTIFYAGRGKKNNKYERIVDQISNQKHYEENQTIIKHPKPFKVYAKFWFLKKAYYLGEYKYKSHTIKKNGKIRYYYIKLVRK